MSNLWSTCSLKTIIKSLTNCPDGPSMIFLVCPGRGCGPVQRVLCWRTVLSLWNHGVFARLRKGKSQKQGQLFSPFIPEDISGRKEPQETTYFILMIVCRTEPCSGSWKASTIFHAGKRWEFTNRKHREVTMLWRQSLRSSGLSEGLCSICFSGLQLAGYEEQTQS